MKRFAASCLLLIGCGSDATAVVSPSDPVGSPSWPVVSGVPAASGAPAVTPPASSAGPTATAQAPAATLAETRPSTFLGLTGVSLNGKVNARGRAASTYFEYGPTASYGKRTPSRPLAPRLAAHYRETWDAGLGGWAGGLSAEMLVPVSSGGASGGFVRYLEPGEMDGNHVDGIGPNEIAQYLYAGFYDINDVWNAAWSAGDPDLRGARVSVSVRGNAWTQLGAELVPWVQSTPDLATEYDPDAVWSNWAFTGFRMTDAVLAGGWQKVEYRLLNDTTQWTYAGNCIWCERSTYVYSPLDDVLGHMNGDLFHMLINAHMTDLREGTIDFDELEVAYRNKSLLLPSNGGKLVSAPANVDDPARLTDGWRNGAGHTYRAEAPVEGPVEFVYAFERPVTLQAIQIHQNPDWPSREVEVHASADGGQTYELVASGELPAGTAAGPNFAYFMQRNLSVLATHLKVRVLSGYAPQYWGLGEIEVFGSGAVMLTDDENYDVNADVVGLARGATVHYRVVVVDDTGLTYGPDVTVTLPETAAPRIDGAGPIRIGGGSVTFEARVYPLGLATRTWFEIGTDTSYGTKTEDIYAGLQNTPRTLVASFSDLTPGTTYHYRLVAESQAGTTTFPDQTFTAK